MMSLRLGPDADARCLVVGGCGGIGRGYVDGLLAAGASVAILDIAGSLEQAPPAGVIIRAIDVRDAEATSAAIRAVAEEWGRIDVFAYVSGINPSRDAVETLKLDDLRATLDVNLIGAFVAARAALPFLRRSASGVMLFVSSGLSVHAEHGFAPYSASKAGLNMLMKTLAREGAPTIRANAIAPGLVDTAFLTGGLARGVAVPCAADHFLAELGPQGDAILASILLRRIARVDDIVGPMLFLSGPASGFMTGQTVHVNGGRHMT